MNINFNDLQLGDLIVFRILEHYGDKYLIDSLRSERVEPVLTFYRSDETNLVQIYTNNFKVNIFDNDLINVYNNKEKIPEYKEFVILEILRKNKDKDHYDIIYKKEF